MPKKIAIAAGIVTVGLVGGTFAFTQLANNNHDCDTTALAGSAIGGPFELRDRAGKTVTEADVITEPTLVYFGYTFCPDFCPLDMARNAAATDILADQNISIKPVFITIDPARDTPEVVGDYAQNFHDKAVGLTGSEEQVAAASRTYKTFYQKQDDDPEYYLMAHSTFTYLVLPDQGFVEFFKQSDTPEQVAEKSSCFIQAYS